MADWYEHVWRAYGYRFPSAEARLARLDEGVQIMQDAWRDGTVSFNGEYYQVDSTIVAPKPLQGNGIPLWIDGGGEKVTLRIAAKYAQYTNFTSEPAAFANKSRVLAQHCQNLGTDRDLGCEYAICYFPAAVYDRSGIELFERAVIPALSREF